MIKDIYSEMIGLRETGGDIWDRLCAMSVAHVFQPLKDAYPEPHKFNPVFFFILDCYSYNSECIVLEGDWQDFKTIRFKANNIDPLLIIDVVKLRDDRVRDTCDNYVNFQKATKWAHLCMLQDLYLQFKNMAIEMNDEVSVDDKYKCAKYAKELLGDIESYKTSMGADYSTLKKAEADLPAPKFKKVSLDLEDYVTAGKRISNVDF
jgi:hypothetical protein